MGEHDIHVLTLRDTQQYEDDEGEAARLGISEASWSLFGVVWDASRVLAELMATHEVEGLRVLEMGSGIGLASLVLNRRGADITGTDRHPRAEDFLARNVVLNGDTPIPFERTGWGDGDDTLGTFDLLIGSDLLYEPAHPALLAGFIDRHARPRCAVVMVDGGRGHAPELSRALHVQGFEEFSSALRGADDISPKRVIEYRRPG